MLYRDEHLVAIDKPAGLLVHRTQLAAGEDEAALQLLRDQLGRTVWPVHRLDRGTSGVLLFALSAEAASLLGVMFEQGRMHKRYLALVRGWPGSDEGLIDHPLARDPELPSAGQPMLEAQTRWRVLERLEWPLTTDPRFATTRVALLEVEPMQGRRHQIRRHLKYIAHPILGDATHGKGPLNRAVATFLGTQRLWLHARELKLAHPITGASLQLQAPTGPGWPVASAMAMQAARAQNQPLHPKQETVMAIQGIKSLYEQRGPVPQDVIGAVPFDLPAPAAGQALVAVLAAPINPSDVLMLTGGYGILPPLPAVGGSEGVGRIVSVGEGVSHLKEGQTVLPPAGSGTWASHLVADAKRLVPLPPGADAQQLSMLTVNPATASLMLSEFVNLQPGDWVIQNVANSGVGGYLTQLAKLRGLRTVNIVRREGAAAVVKADGGDVVLVDGDDLAKRVKDAVSGAPIRLGIDAVGGKATNRLAMCVAEGGTVVNYGLMSGEPCVVSPQSFVFNDITLRGFWLAKWFKVASREAQMALYGELTKLIATGQLKARIHATYPVEQIKDAIAAAATGERDGKILVVPRHG